MTKLTFIVISIFSLSLNADYKKKTHSHKHDHGAHVHGAGTLNIAFDQLNGKVEFKSSADSIIGFEHEAKTAKQKDQLRLNTEKFETKLPNMISFSNDLNCVWKKEKIEIQRDSEEKNHSDFIATFNVTCAKTPINSTLKINFFDFKKIKDLDITVLVDTVQKSAEYKGKPIIFQIK
jgi:hypothetical protein